MTQQAPASTTQNHTASPRILIVDDEPEMCEICARTLRSAGYQVTATTSAATALSELRPDQPFDLLLVDIQMPGVSGLELAQRARELDPSVVVIIMTGHASFENLQQSARGGVADFLSKPFELEELRRAVEQVLHKRRLLQERLRLRALEQLLESSEALNGILDREALGRVILERALGHVAAMAGFLLLSASAQHEVLAIPTGWRLSPSGLEQALTAYCQATTLILDGAEALCADGVQQARRGLAVPLRAHGEVVGVIMLCDESPEVIRGGNQEIISLLANQAGTALHNAMLYGQVQEAYQSLRELDRLKSEFIAIASHELRTPLSIVLGYALMVRDQSEGERREYAQRVLASAQRIKELVDDMVSLRNLELHETSLSLDSWDLETLLREGLERHQPAAQENGQALTVESVAATLVIDREKQLLVLGNLISNAIKFSHKGGSISISGQIWSRDQLREALQAAVPNSTFRQFERAADQQWAVIRVLDKGIGIERSEQARIFDRFYQVADSLTRKQGGAGLGLALVRDLTDLQGGVVWIESELGQGSVFSCALPYRETEALRSMGKRDIP